MHGWIASALFQTLGATPTRKGKEEVSEAFRIERELQARKPLVVVVVVQEFFNLQEN